jgi:tellurite resistance protein
MYLSSFTDQQKKTFFCLAHDVVVSDGELSVGEHVMMEAMRREMNLSQDFEAHYLPLEGVEKIFDTKRSRSSVLISLMQLAYADGAFEIEEQFLILKLCSLFETTDEDLHLIDNWVRRLIALEREANGFM